MMVVHSRLPYIVYKGLTAEKGILTKAWWGFKDKKSIVAGIRTGLTGGAISGSFMEDQSNPFDSGQIPKGKQSPSYKQRQSNNRQYTSRRRRRSSFKRSGCNCC